MKNKDLKNFKQQIQMFKKVSAGLNTPAKGMTFIYKGGDRCTYCTPDDLD